MSNSTAAQADGLLVGYTSPVVLTTPFADRENVIIHNQQHVLYVKCGYGASPTDFTYRLTSNTTLEITGYIGVITAIASDNYTFVRVTELH